ncbi:MAG: DUF3368 domain-containing protein [Cytophagales bacterium]|nr:DUF3368 domain-containing protein [Cytophagales bacterium]
MASSFLVADSGPLIALAIADLLPTAAAQYQPLLVPETVLRECLASVHEAGTWQIQSALDRGDIQSVRTEAKNSTEDLTQSQAIGAGEASVIHYAKAHKLTALIDDKRAISIAKRLDVAVVRSGAILVDLKRRGAIASIKPVLDAWQAHGYFLADSVRTALLAQAKEV